MDLATAVNFAADRIGVGAEHFSSTQAIWRPAEGPVEAVVLFHNYTVMDRGSEIEISFATDNPRRLTRILLEDTFCYCFDQLAVTRVYCQHKEGDARVSRLLKGLGFQREGVLRKRWDGEAGSVFWSMLRDECRWLPAVTDEPEPEVN